MDALAKADLQQRLLDLHAVDLEHALGNALEDDGFSVLYEAVLQGGDQHVDLIAEKRKKLFAIEVQRRATLHAEDLRSLYALAQAPRQYQRVVAYPGTADIETRQVAQTTGVELWGMDQWAYLFVKSPGAMAQLGATARFSRPSSPRSPEDFQRRAARLLAQLSGIEAGSANWHMYQEFVTEVAEFLFSPVLGPPEVERSDRSGRDRRDFIMENLAESGFWHRARQRYGADYILFDAKNGRVVNKKDVTVFAHYLKPYGLGMFGVLFTRQAPSKAAVHAMREQWAGTGRMIVAICDEQLRSMLEKKRDGTAPEVVISDAIAAMRMDM